MDEAVDIQEFIALLGPDRETKKQINRTTDKKVCHLSFVQQLQEFFEVVWKCLIIPTSLVEQG
jgi:hypothetical protein